MYGSKSKMMKKPAGKSAKKLSPAMQKQMMMMKAKKGMKKK